jgi:hypothetical protein
MATAHQPSSTRLHNIPVVVDGQPWTCVLYTNDLAVTDPSRPALMIVPFPNPTGAAEFGLVDIAGTKQYRERVETAFKRYETSPAMFMNQSYGLDGAKSVRGRPAAVIEVGNYRCSVVPNAEALLTSVQWHRFHTPADLATRLSVLQSPSVLPAGCGFVVAEAMRTVRKDGFGIVFPGDHVFFPTCHEGGPAEHDYDVCCYAANGALAADLPSTWLPYHAFKTTKDVGLDAAAALLPLSMKSSYDGHAMSVRPAANITHFAFTHLFGKGPNRNVGGTRIAMPADPTAPRAVPVPVPEPLLLVPGSHAYALAPPTRLGAADIATVVRLGQLYPRASMHYSGGAVSHVFCDGCGATITDQAAYGLVDKDVCMSCAFPALGAGTGAGAPVGFATSAAPYTAPRF